MPEYLRPYVSYLVRLACWGVEREGHEWFDDRVGHDLFGDRIAADLLSRGLMVPWGTTRNGAPAYRPTKMAFEIR